MSHSESGVPEIQSKQSLAQRLTTDIMEDVLDTSTSVISPWGAEGQNTDKINQPTHPTKQVSFSLPQSISTAATVTLPSTTAPQYTLAAQTISKKHSPPQCNNFTPREFSSPSNSNYYAPRESIANGDHSQPMNQLLARMVEQITNHSQIIQEVLSQRNRSTDDLKLKQHKAFKQLLGQQATTFDGTNAAQFKAWKNDIQVEVEHLDLSHTQWIQLLEARTTGEPNSIVKRSKIIQIESGPKCALKTVWENLNLRYETTRRPAQELFEKLTTGPELRSSDTESLFAFLQRCKAAQKLHQQNPDFLREIEDQTSLDALIRRLDSELRRRWLLHRRMQLGFKKEVYFQDFTDWIQVQAEVSRDARDLFQTQHSGYENPARSKRLSPTASSFRPQSYATVHTTYSESQ